MNSLLKLADTGLMDSEVTEGRSVHTHAHTGAGTY